MTFCRIIIKETRKLKLNSPQINKKYVSGNPEIKADYKRESVIAALNSGLIGSLTVESALVIPLFLFAMIALIYMTEVIRFSGNLQAAMSETAREAAVYAYPYKELTGSDSLGGMAGSKIFAAVGAKAVVMDSLGESYIGNSPVRRGSGGVSFIHSKILENDLVDLAAVWVTDIPYIPDEIRPVKIIDRARVRAFTGYDNTHASSEEEEAEEDIVVYVTEYGSVYHKSRDCRHLRLNIESVGESELKGKRNEYGGKYYECEFCGAGTAANYYISSDGDRYHRSRTCPGLKRSIHEVHLAETDLPGCSDCAR